MVTTAVDPRGREVLTALMAERNPDHGISAIMQKTDREVELNSIDPTYRLFVAELGAKVVGLCRYFHSDALPKAKLAFPAPTGWYCMGIIVDQEFRRKGIARFLFQNRLESLKNQGANVIYSMVDSENMTSMKMHQEFGFKVLERAVAGFFIE